ncbi:PPE family protein [Nocardia sp. NPDC004722]
MPSLPFDFGACPPEWHAARLFASPGPGPLKGVAATYTAVAHELAATALAADGSMKTMAVNYISPASDRVQQAFGDHARWMQIQAAKAADAAALIAAVAEACDVAFTAMAIIVEAAATVHLNRFVLGATNALGQNTAALAANEATYAALTCAAAEVMYAYAGFAVSTLSALPQPSPAPPIVALGAPGVAPAPMAMSAFGGGAHHGGSTRAGASPMPSDASGAGPTGSGGNPSSPETSPGAPASGGTGQSGPAPGPGSSGPVGGSEPAPPQSLSQLPQALSPTGPPSGDLGANGADPAADTAGIAEQSGFYGTSPESPTLAGLNGGAGSAVTLTMLRGGLGAMPGTATGFRMPANWNPSTTQAFGAATRNSPATQPPPSRPAPKGASAPESLSRRRRRDEAEHRTGKVFTPGEEHDIPMLEQALTIGVIESGDHDDDPESAAEQLLAVGVLDTVAPELHVLSEAR